MWIIGPQTDIHSYYYFYLLFNLKCNCILQAFVNICCNFTTWVSQQPSTRTTKEVGGCKILVLRLKSLFWCLKDSWPGNCSFCSSAPSQRRFQKYLFFPAEREPNDFQRNQNLPRLEYLFLPAVMISPTLSWTEYIPPLLCKISCIHRVLLSSVKRYPGKGLKLIFVFYFMPTLTYLKMFSMQSKLLCSPILCSKLVFH